MNTWIKNSFAAIRAIGVVLTRTEKEGTESIKAKLAQLALSLELDNSTVHGVEHAFGTHWRNAHPQLNGV